jgi:hypothetical protein
MKNELKKLKDIKQFIKDNSWTGMDYENQYGWIYCNIKNHGFIGKDELIEHYPKKYSRFINELSDEYIMDMQWDGRKWEFEYVVDCINDAVDGSDWEYVSASKYSYGRSGGWLGIAPFNESFGADEVENMIEDIESVDEDDWRWEKDSINQCIKAWEQIMECKDWIEDYANKYSDKDYIIDSIDNNELMQWDEQIQREKDIKLIKKLAKKHGLQVGRRI